MDLDLLFQPNLLPGEQIVWTGRPAPGHLLTGADIMLIPFSVVWASLAILWEGVALSSAIASGGVVDLFALWGIPFVVAGLYLLVGRFFIKAYVKQHTFYAVTNQRVLLLSTLWRSRFQSAYLDSLPGLSISQGADGVGTITFGNALVGQSMYVNTAWPAWGGSASALGDPLSGLYDVPNAQGVYQTIGKLRRR